MFILKNKFSELDSISNIQYFLNSSEYISLNIPLPSIDYTQHPEDICLDYAAASYFVERIHKQAFIKSLVQVSLTNNHHYELEIIPHSNQDLIKTFESMYEHYNNSDNLQISDEIFEHYENIISYNIELRHHNIADNLLANYVGGVLYDFEEWQLANALNENTEMRMGFWKSLNDSKINALKSFNIVIFDSNHTPKAIQELCKLTSITLVEADFRVVNSTMYFISSAGFYQDKLNNLFNSLLAFKSRFQKVYKEEDEDLQTFSEDSLISDSIKALTSDSGDILVLQVGHYSYVGLFPKKVHQDEIDKSFPLAINNYAEIVNELIKLDRLPWNKIGPNEFESLCYDVIYSSSLYDNSTLHRMGHTNSSDGGKDLTVYKYAEMMKSPKKMIIQCKYTKHSSLKKGSLDKAISDIIIDNKAHGYVLMSNADIDSRIHQLLENIAEKFNIEIDIWCRDRLEKHILYRPWIFERYFNRKA